MLPSYCRTSMTFPGIRLHVSKGTPTLLCIPRKTIDLEGLSDALGVADLEAKTAGCPCTVRRQPSVLFHPNEEGFDVNTTRSLVDKVLVISTGFPDPLRAEIAHVPGHAADCDGGYACTIVVIISRKISLDHDLVSPIIEPQVVCRPSNGCGVVGRNGHVPRRRGGCVAINSSRHIKACIRVGQHPPKIGIGVSGDVPVLRTGGVQGLLVARASTDRKSTRLN